MPLFRSVSSATGSLSLSIPPPTGLSVNDVMVGLIADLGVLTSVPPGWTQLSADPWVYAKIATPADVAASSFDWTGTGTQAIGFIEAYSASSGWGAFASGSAPSGSAVVPSIIVTDAGSKVVALLYVGGPNSCTPDAGWTERIDLATGVTVFSDDKTFGPGATGTSLIGLSGGLNGYRSFALELHPIHPAVTMQAAFTFLADGSHYHGTTAEAQAASTFTAQASQVFAAEAHLQADFRFIAEATGTHALDFTVFDGYIETQHDFFGLMFYDDPYPGAQTFGPLSRSTPITRSRALQPVRQDVGNNPAEIRPEFGDIFAQNDFSHGGGQTYFHQLGRDPKRFFTSEGYDISSPGRLSHLHKLAPAFLDALTSSMTQAGGLPFVAVGDLVKRGDGNLPGTWTDEDPSAAEANQTVLSLASEGARLFAALGPAGVHIRSSAGVWSHFQPDGSTDLNIDPANVVAWVKDRLMVIGGTGGRSIYEIAAISAPTAIHTLKEGWQFVSIGEAGGFIEACAVNLDSGQSIIYSYGLNSGATAIERKSSTPMPVGQLAWTVDGYIGTAFIGGGKVNAAGGYDPFLYRATVNDLGELDYFLIRQEKGSGAADLSVRSITPIGESVLVSWTLGSGANFGEARDGIAIYNLARDSFARHLRREGAGGANKVLSILPYQGHILVAIESFGLYYEDLNTLVDQAFVVTSLADWNNAGNKVWDQIEISHDALPTGTAVVVDYTTQQQAVGDWNNALISNVPGEPGSVSRLSTTTSRTFALRITSTSSGLTDPGVQSFAVRSHPSPARPEWDLARYVRALSVDRKDENGTLIYRDPREIMHKLRRAVNTWITFYESGVTWTAFLTDVFATEPAQPFYDSRSGEPLKDAFIVQLQMTGTEG